MTVDRRATVEGGSPSSRRRVLAVAVAVLQAHALAACTNDQRVLRPMQDELRTAMRVHDAVSVLASGGLGLLAATSVRPNFGKTPDDAVEQFAFELFTLLDLEIFCNGAVERIEPNQVKVALDRCNQQVSGVTGGDMTFLLSADYEVFPRQFQVETQLDGRVEDTAGNAVTFRGSMFHVFYQGGVLRPKAEEVGIGVNGVVSGTGIVPITVQADGWLAAEYSSYLGLPIVEVFKRVDQSALSALIFGQSDSVRLTLGVNQSRLQPGQPSACPRSGSMSISGDHLQTVIFNDDAMLAGNPPEDISSLCGQLWRAAFPDLQIVQDGGLDGS